jgi:metal-responsive CopG/Arc/MetJ family transcriptional regulator
MAIKKTAISIEKPLFDEVEAMAEEMKVSRSHFYSLAAREFIKRHNNQKVLDTLNAVYADLPDLAEETLMTRMKSKHRRMVKDQW